ncbi:prephenate dehydratase [Paenibacillus turpanensis]|uniref:prephenate dehydratase n=1 Tax=Paenibacillus turpanensis TaxID=2689078 RepID=UPI00140C8620|nr:prephenate dehydratase [Paenibacillus turpanensis]
MIRYSYLGPGTFSEEASRNLFGSLDTEAVACKHIADVFGAILDGRVEYAVVPIENTIEGSVSLHLDWLVHEVDIPIQAEWEYPISMNLLGLGKEDSLSRIRKVISHSVAYTQCRTFLREVIPQAEFEAASSTAEGARIVKELGDPEVAAIGVASAASLYGLNMIVPNVQDHQNNYTRFVVIGNKPLPEGLPREPVKWKTTILVIPPEDVPGSLHQVLSAFAWRRINLSKLESRPTKKKLGNYYFYIDIEAALDEVLLPAAFSEIQALGCQVRLMGSYPAYGSGV